MLFLSVTMTEAGRFSSQYYLSLCAVLFPRSALALYRGAWVGQWARRWPWPLIQATQHRWERGEVACQEKGLSPLQNIWWYMCARIVTLQTDYWF